MVNNSKLSDIDWVKNENNNIVHSENINNVKTLLNKTGCGFCLAKFTQVTMHLGTGTTHACHHPKPHKIPLDEIQKDPAALFNTTHLKSARKEMLDGKRPAECDYCGRIEDNKSPSDRFYKSLEPWALEHHDKIVNSDPTENIFPTYLEVDFSNACNFACTYCGPEFSSKWVENLKHHGPVKLLEGTPHEQWSHGWQDLDKLNYKHSEFNPYIDAFWKWFPEAYKHLKVYRITGGEPLLSKETFRSMDWLIENPNPELEFNINSNMGVPEKLWQQFIDKLVILTSGNYIKKFTLFTSADGWGERAEYARPGLDFELFKKRYEQLLQLGKVRVVTMCAFNIFSITSIIDLLKWQVELKAKYNPNQMLAQLEKDFLIDFGESKSHTEKLSDAGNHHGLVGIDLPYLRSPAFLDAHYADKELIQNYLIPAMNYMSDNTRNISWGIHRGFLEDYEVEKLKRIVMECLYFNKSNKDDSEVVLIHRARFYDFVNDIDRRHDRSFVETFPEMINFYDKCKVAKERLCKK